MVLSNFKLNSFKYLFIFYFCAFWIRKVKFIGHLLRHNEYLLRVDTNNVHKSVRTVI